MCKWKECKCSAALVEVWITLLVGNVSNPVYVTSKVVYGKHYTLRVTSCTRGVVEQNKLVIWYISILNIVRSKTSRVTLTIVLSHLVDALGHLITTALKNHVVVS